MENKDIINVKPGEPPILDVVSEEEDPLKARLRIATQHKEPVVNTKKAWNFDLSESEIKKETETKNDQETQTVNSESSSTSENNISEKQPPTKMTQGAKHSSARIAVGMLDLTQKGIFIPLLQRKYKKKFTPEEQELVLSIQDKNKKDLDEKEIVLSNKFDRLMSKMNKKIDEVPLEKTEKNDLEEAWFTYFDVTEKDLPPIYLVAMAMINSIGKRSIDLFTD